MKEYTLEEFLEGYGHAVPDSLQGATLLKISYDESNGGSMVMTADIQLGSALKIENGKTVTLDLNGKTLSTPQ